MCVRACVCVLEPCCECLTKLKDRLDSSQSACAETLAECVEADSGQVIPELRNSSHNHMDWAGRLD